MVWSVINSNTLLSLKYRNLTHIWIIFTVFPFMYIIWYFPFSFIYRPWQRRYLFFYHFFFFDNLPKPTFQFFFTGYQIFFYYFLFLESSIFVKFFFSYSFFSNSFFDRLPLSFFYTILYVVYVIWFVPLYLLNVFHMYTHFYFGMGEDVLYEWHWKMCLLWKECCNFHN